ncbi:MAG: Abi family protein [Lachnospiraceae bacterium]|nr:Abi family protein [Lachnospiraceae bacterium]
MKVLKPQQVGMPFRSSKGGDWVSKKRFYYSVFEKNTYPPRNHYYDFLKLTSQLDLILTIVHSTINKSKEKSYYTETKGDNDKNKRLSNKKFFNNKLFKNIQIQEKELRQNVNKHPELKEYRSGGSRSKKKISCWAAFTYFEFGVITNIYAFLRGDLRKRVLLYGYAKRNYGKEVTKQLDTWLDAVRNIRNVCAHHNKLIGKTSSVVLTT